MSRATQVPPRNRLGCRVHGFHVLRPSFPEGSAILDFSLYRRSYNPGRRLHAPGLGSCAFARHYLRNRCYFLFLRVLRCFSSPGSPRLLAGAAVASGGLPHSDIRDSKGICPSSRLFAACHVLLRLREPRHPSCALLSFPFSSPSTRVFVSLIRYLGFRSCSFLDSIYSFVFLPVLSMSSFVL